MFKVYQATMYVGNYHGNGSDGQHVCTKYHGHTQATMLEIVINCLREIVIKRAVAM